MKRFIHPYSTDRRTFLRGTGAALALPALECMQPLRTHAAVAGSENPQRFVAVHVALSMHPTSFFPMETGNDYTTPLLLQPLEKHRKDFTVFSGLDHPDVSGGHRGIVTFLTGQDVYGFPGYDFRNTVSLDQVYAEHVGSETRFSSMQLATTGNRSASSSDISWTREGISLQPTSRPRDVFDQLFTERKATNAQDRQRNYQRKVSLLDRVLQQAKSLDSQLGKADREKLDEYLTAVRSVEKRIEKAESWATTPKPRVGMPRPDFNSNSDNDLFENMKIMYELIALAFETDSTRSIVLQIPSNNTVYAQLDGVTEGYHALSHHGRDEAKIAQLLKIETEHTRALAGFLDRLKGSNEQGTSMLDSTTVLFGSGMGNAAAHSNKKLPVLVAGGGFKSHGAHRTFESNKKPPLSNLYTSLLQNMGVETDSFATSTGTLSDFG